MLFMSKEKEEKAVADKAKEKEEKAKPKLPVRDPRLDPVSRSRSLSTSSSRSRSVRSPPASFHNCWYWDGVRDRATFILLGFNRKTY